VREPEDVGKTHGSQVYATPTSRLLVVCVANSNGGLLLGLALLQIDVVVRQPDWRYEVGIR
jgi:hypothetical protein